MNVLVTGCSRGIGKEIINTILNSNYAVKNIIAISRSSIDIVNTNKNIVLHKLNIDITDFINFKNQLLSYFQSNNINQIDVLINNAGAIVNKPFQEITIEDVNNVYDTNLKAPFFLIQTILPYMEKSLASHIVNISSIGGFMGSSKFPGLSAYSSSKGALTTLTECLAEEFKEKNISVNCLCIGSVNTQMLQNAFPEYIANTSPEQMAKFIVNFAFTGKELFNGKILPISATTP